MRLGEYETVGEYQTVGDVALSPYAISADTSYGQTYGLGAIGDLVSKYKVPLLVAGGLAALWYAKKKRMF